MYDGRCRPHKSVATIMFAIFGTEINMISRIKCLLGGPLHVCKKIPDKKLVLAYYTRRILEKMAVL